MNMNFLKLKGILAGKRAYSDDKLDKLIIDEKAKQYVARHSTGKCKGCKNRAKYGKFCKDCSMLRIKLQLSRLGWLNRDDSLSLKVRRNGDNRTG